MRKAGVVVELRVTARVAPGVVVPTPSLPAKLECVVEVETTKPEVSDPIDEEETNSLIAWDMAVKKLVEVALLVTKLVILAAVEVELVVVAFVAEKFVAKRFTKVEVAVEVAVIVPVVRVPIEEEETNSLMARNMVANKEVEVALVATRLVTKPAVVVEFVEVALSAMKVEEAKKAV
jgi:hypothetical protein